VEGSSFGFTVPAYAVHVMLSVVHKNTGTNEIGNLSLKPPVFMKKIIRAAYTKTLAISHAYPDRLNQNHQTAACASAFKAKKDPGR
jgi:hypothetical protein